MDQQFHPPSGSDASLRPETLGAAILDTVTGAYSIGEIVRDGVGDRFVCIVAGAPGTWRKLGGTIGSGGSRVVSSNSVSAR